MTSTTLVAGVAAALVDARRRATALPSFPGPLPATLDDAYAIQIEATALWGDQIAGWKVGRLPLVLADRFGTDRFIGPVFAASLGTVPAEGAATFPVFAGGGAGFEAEYVAVIGDAQASGAPAGAVRALHIGIEFAGNPLPAVPAPDTLMTVACFGNNNGGIIGACLPAALLATPDRLRCTVAVDGLTVGSAAASALPGGPATALSFARAQAERLGMPLRPGQIVFTGAVTGVHPVAIGQRGVADFGGWGTVTCTAAAMRP